MICVYLGVPGCRHFRALGARASEVSRILLNLITFASINQNSEYEHKFQVIVLFGCGGYVLFIKITDTLSIPSDRYVFFLLRKDGIVNALIPSCLHEGA